MKRILVLFLTLAITSLSYAQEENTPKGLVAGGSIGLTNSNQEDTDVFNSGTISIESVRTTSSFAVSINPYIGKQVNEKSLVGFGIYAGHSAQEYTYESGANESFTKTNNTTLGANLFYRYFPVASNKIQFFIQPYASFRTSFGKIEQLAPAIDETKGNLYSAGVDYGGIYSFSPKWHFLVNVAGISYNYSKSRKASQAESSTSGIFNINSSLRNIRLGIERRF